MKKQNVFFASAAVVWIVLLLLLASVLSTVGYIAYQHFFGTRIANVNTEVIRNSNQYITTQQTRMLDLVADYNRDEVALSEGADPSAIHPQELALIDQIKQSAGTLDSKWIPVAVQAFLLSH